MSKSTIASSLSPEGVAGQVLITRNFDAPRDLVFQAWTDPAHLTRWHAPHGCSIEFRSFECSEGGRFHSCIHTPDGYQCWCVGEYLEVDRPQRLVYRMISADANGQPVEPRDLGMDPDWPQESVVTLTFEEEAGKTKLTLHQTVSESLAKRTGAYPSWLQMFDRLAEDIASQQTASTEEELVVSRTFQAPRERVWQAYSEVENLKQWWGPKGFAMQVATLDFRPGGMFHYGMKTPDGKMMWGKLTYREIVPRERLVNVVAFSDENGGTTQHPFAPVWPRELLGAMTLSEQDGKTTITIRVVPHEATEAERNAFIAGREGMKMGFKGSLDQLESLLANR
jgi:uncharacterized protein YndB with AHSA1/START domain